MAVNVADFPQPATMQVSKKTRFESLWFGVARLVQQIAYAPVLWRLSCEKVGYVET